MTGASAAVVPPGRFLSLWEPRLKLLGMLCIVFGFAAVQEIRLVPVMIAAALVIYLMSSLPLSYLASRMRLPGVFLVALAVLLPFFSGDTVLLQLGPLSLKREGALAFMLVAAKFFCIITVAAVLFASTPMSGLVGAMRSMGLPSLLADMLMFTHRYIYQLGADIRRARTAARLRGARLKSLGSLRTTAYIVGSLLVRSHDQAERVFQAMTLRGYGSSTASARKTRPRVTDVAAFTACIALAAGLVLLQVLVF